MIFSNDSTSSTSAGLSVVKKGDLFVGGGSTVSHLISEDDEEKRKLGLRSDLRLLSNWDRIDVDFKGAKALAFENKMNEFAGGVEEICNLLLFYENYKFSANFIDSACCDFALTTSAPR